MCCTVIAGCCERCYCAGGGNVVLAQEGYCGAATPTICKNLQCEGYSCVAKELGCDASTAISKGYNAIVSLPCKIQAEFPSWTTIEIWAVVIIIALFVLFLISIYVFGKSGGRIV